MEESNIDKSINKFLKKQGKVDVSKHHKQYLGTTVPEGYFTKSKLSILEKIKQEQVKAPKKQKVFWLRANFRYAVAASLIFMLSLTVWLQNTQTNYETDIHVALLSFNEDVLVNSLFLDDDEIETYTAITLINEVVIKAELSEQRMDDLILDSMILEDSLSGDNFIETIIL